MVPGLQVVNDTIVAVGKPFAEYTPRELRVREAMLLLTCALPLLGSGLILLLRDGWWKAYQRFSVQTVAAAWIASIAIVGAVVYFQHGDTTRATFVLAILHEQIEVLLNSVLLGVSARHAFGAAWSLGLILFLATLALADMAAVFLLVAIIGGTGDFLIALLFAYGKQYLYALGALGHVVSAVAIFTSFTRNTGVVGYNITIFLAVWAHVGFTAYGIWTQEEKHHEYKGAMTNPLGGVNFTKHTLFILMGSSLAVSTIASLFLVFVF